MSLFAAGKNCNSCKNSQSIRDKARYRDAMFDFFFSVIGICHEEVEMGIAGEDDLSSLHFFIRQLEVACFNCDGTSGEVYEKIKNEYVAPMQKEISAVIKEAEEAKKSKKKKKQKRNVVIKVNFSKK